MSSFDGTYAVVTSGIAGFSVAVVDIRNGQIMANDISGSRHRGTVVDNGDGLAVVNLEMQIVPNAMTVWGSAETETVQIRNLPPVTVPISVFDGRSYTLPGYEMGITLTRLSDDMAEYAYPDGLSFLLKNLTDAQRAWQRFDEAQVSA